MYIYIYIYTIDRQLYSMQEVKLKFEGRNSFYFVDVNRLPEIIRTFMQKSDYALKTTFAQS